MCGILVGQGLSVRDTARVQMLSCQFYHNSVAISAEGSGRLLLSGCKFVGSRFASLHCACSTKNVIWIVEDCVIHGNVGTVWLNERRPTHMEWRNVSIRIARHMKEVGFPDRPGGLEDYNAHPKVHANLLRRKVESTRNYCCCQCPTCQWNNEILDAERMDMAFRNWEV